MTLKEQKPRRPTGASKDFEQRSTEKEKSRRKSTPGADASLQELPERVRRALMAGWPVIPLTAAKVPLKGTNWTRFRETPPSREQVAAWLEEHSGRIGAWGFLAGCGRAPLVIDCDDRHGGEPTYLSLEWPGLTGFMKTPGGHHIYVKPPDWPVKTVSQGDSLPGFPGLEVKTGSLVTFWHKTRSYEREEGGKVWRWEDLDRLAPELCKAIQEHSKAEVGDSGRAWTPSTEPAALQLAVARLRELGPVTKTDDEPPNYRGLCPSLNHKSKRPKFYIRLGDDRLLIFNCFTGQCDIDR